MQEVVIVGNGNAPGAQLESLLMALLVGLLLKKLLLVRCQGRSLLLLKDRLHQRLEAWQSKLLLKSLKKSLLGEILRRVLSLVVYHLRN